MIAGLLSAACSPDEVQLEPGVPIAREITGNRNHRYAVALEQGHYLDLPVNQNGIDVTVTVLDPNRQELLIVDSPNGREGVEQVMVVAPESGNYYVTVSTGEAPRGNYEIKIAARRRATEADVHRAEATGLLNEGQQLRLKRGQELSAVSAFRQAVEAFRTAGEPAWEAETRGRIGLALEATGRTAEAAGDYQAAADIYRSLGHHNQEATILNRVGRVWRIEGEFQQALDAYRLALKRYQTTDRRYGQATTLNNMALLYKSVGETQQALDLYNNALALWRGLKDAASAEVTLTNIAGLYIALGQYDFALDALDEALRSGSDLTPDRRAITFSTLGSARLGLDQPDRALEEFRRALELRRSAGNRRGMAVELNNIGNTHYELEQLAPAQDAYQQALEAFLEAGDRQAAAYARLNLGWIYLDRGDPGKALELFELALPDFLQIGDPRGEASALYSLARAAADRDNLEIARARVEKSLERVEALRRGSLSQAARSSYLATKHHYYELLIDVLMRLHERLPEASEPAGGPTEDYPALAFAENERSRARSLLETLAESSADIRQGIDASLIDRERTLQAQLNLLGDRLILERGKPDSDRTAALEEELRNRLREYQELQAEIRISSPKWAALTRPEPLEAWEIQQVLDDDTLLLEYSLGDRRSYLWLVSSESIRSFVLPGREEIEARAREVHSLLRRSARPDVTVQARLVTEALSQVLLGPVADQLGSKRLVVVATGALQYLPFAALRLPDPEDPSKMRPVVIDHEVVSLPSASLLAVLRQEIGQRTPAPRAVAVVGDPVLWRADPRIESGLEEQPPGETEFLTSKKPSALLTLDALLFAQEEMQAILDLVPEDQRLGAAGFEANRELVLSGALSDYRIVHFVTHGVVDTRHPELSGIVLSLFDRNGRQRDGFLRAHEIYNLALPAELAVLSACETALGQEVRGEGLIGLTQGLMYAGAARVIVSLWSVSDPSTAELMSRFYRGVLQEELRPAAALRAAQISMLEEERWAAPYYWAPFILQGEWL